MFFFEKDFIEIVSCNLINWNLLKNKSLLITGGTGLIGSYIIRTLMYLNDTILKNHKIKIISVIRNLKYAKKIFAENYNRSDFDIINKDICDITEKDVPNINYIIHTASPSRPDKNYPVNVIKPNSIGTFNLLNIAKEKKIDNFIFLSSGEIYGDIKKKNFCELDYGYLDPTHIRNCYSVSKRFSENLCISYFHQYKVPVKIIRLFHTYGPSMNIDKDIRVFSKFINLIKNNKEIIIYNNSINIKRCFCYITDFIIGLFIILFNKDNNNLVFNLANTKQNISILNLAKLLIKIANKNIQIKIEKCNDNSYLKSPIEYLNPSTDKLNSLGWSPKISIEEGFKRIFKIKLI